MNTKPTTDVLLEAADYLEYSAKELRRHAADIDKDRHFGRVGSALNFMLNIFQNLRADLLVVRPVREMERELYDARHSQ